jgi:tetratricopeptide (TPR) repeat protein
MSKFDENPYRPCPCGSGEKYKFCCLEKDREERRMSPPMKLLPGYDQPPDNLVDEAIQAHDRGTELIGRLRGREAIPYIEKAIRLNPRVPNPYNNLAIAHFLEGDIEKALQISERVDREIDPDNVFALGQKVHYLILLGRREEAKATGDRLLSLRCHDGSAFVKKCEALARLGRHAEVLATALEGLRFSPDERTGLEFFAGVAAANLGRYKEAERHLVPGLEDRALGRTAASNLERIRKKQGPGTLSGEWPYLEWGFWMLPSLLQRLATPEAARQYPGIVETVSTLLDDRFADPAVLHVLGLVGTPEAIDLLRKIAFGTFGTESLRTAALMILHECGAVADGKELRMWLGGEWREIKPVRQELTIEAARPLVEELRPKMSKMLRLIKSRKWSEAERLGREIVDRAPESPQALHNLAMALRYGGKRSEAEEILRRLMTSDPGYLYAPAALATMKLEDGKLEEAQSALRSVELREKVDPGGYVTYLLAQAEVAVREDDFESAMRSWRAAEDLAPDHPAVIESRNNPVRWLTELRQNSAKRARDRMTRKQNRLLSADPTAEEIWSDATVGDLRTAAQALRLPRLSGLKKESLRRKVVEAFGDLERVRMLVSLLPPAQKEALRQIAAAGGPLPYGEHLKSWSRPLGEKPPATGASPVDRLAEVGLVAIGMVGHEVAIVIPSCLRSAIQSGLAS